MLSDYFLQACWYQQKDVVIDPYLMGYLLGDGSLGKNSVKLSCFEEGHFDYMETLLPDGCFLRGKSENEKCITADNKPGGNIVLEEIRKLGLAMVLGPDKFIPPLYLFNISAIRLDLLRGLLDSDGTISKDRRTNSYKVHFYTSSKHLRDNIVWIVRSLEGISSYSTRKAGYVGGKTDGRDIIAQHDNYTVRINLPNNINPFRIKRKKDMYDKWVSTVKREPVRIVKSIDLVDKI